MQIRHILVTTDLSSESLDPCEVIAGFAREVGARLTLLHVVESYAPVAHGASFAAPLPALGLEEELVSAHRAIEAERERFGPDLDVRTDVVTGERAADAIVLYAREHEVDLVALSTHGRTGFRHMVLGSVTEAVVRKAGIPVLCFPRAKEAEGE